MEGGGTSGHFAFPPLVRAIGPSGEQSSHFYQATVKQGELATTSFLSSESGTGQEAQGEKRVGTEERDREWTSHE